MKPIVLSQVGSKWHVFVDVPAARRFHAKGPRIKAFPADAELVPVVRKGKGLDLDVGGEPAKFTKAEAEGLAHQIGNYMLGLGSFVDTYTETRRTPARDPQRKKPLFQIMRDRDGYWLWQSGAYVPLVLTYKSQPKSTLRRAVRTLTGEKDFFLSVKTANELGRTHAKW